MAGAAGVEVHGPARAAFGQILTPEALDFVAALQRELGPTRLELLERRRQRQQAF
jgi:malate synthase